MKNKDFFYLQYNKVDWFNQEITLINKKINEYIIKIILDIINKFNNKSILLLDIWFWTGFFISMLYESLINKNINFYIHWCEPSEKNFNFFKVKSWNFDNKKIVIQNSTILNFQTNQKFDFITSIYVFPHILFEDLELTLSKIYSILNSWWYFAIVIANYSYVEKKLSDEKDLFIEKNDIEYNKEIFTEILHYSDIPEIWKIIDFNREEKLYELLFHKVWFYTEKKEIINDNWFLATLFLLKK